MNSYFINDLIQKQYTTKTPGLKIKYRIHSSSSFMLTHAFIYQIFIDHLPQIHFNLKGKQTS